MWTSAHCPRPVLARPLLRAQPPVPCLRLIPYCGFWNLPDTLGRAPGRDAEVSGAPGHLCLAGAVPACPPGPRTYPSSALQPSHLRSPYSWRAGTFLAVCCVAAWRVWALSPCRGGGCWTAVTAQASCLCAQVQGVTIWATATAQRRFLLKLTQNYRQLQDSVEKPS